MNSELSKFIGLSDHDQGLETFYDKVLEKAVNLPELLPFLEVGVRLGATSLIMLKAIKESGKRKRHMIAVDTYGEPQSNDAVPDYGKEQQYRFAMRDIFDYCVQYELRYTLFRMSSFDFIETYHKMRLWRNFQTFGFVYIDGNHLYTIVEKELEYFQKHIAEEGIISIDDIHESKNMGSKIMDRYISKCTIVEDRAYLEY